MNNQNTSTKKSSTTVQGSAGKLSANVSEGKPIGGSVKSVQVEVKRKKDGKVVSRRRVFLLAKDVLAEAG